MYTHVHEELGLLCKLLDGSKVEAFDVLKPLIQGMHSILCRQEVGPERPVFPVHHGKHSTTALGGYILRDILLKH